MVWVSVDHLTTLIMYLNFAADRGSAKTKDYVASSLTLSHLKRERTDAVCSLYSDQISFFNRFKQDLFIE